MPEPAPSSNSAAPEGATAAKVTDPGSPGTALNTMSSFTPPPTAKSSVRASSETTSPTFSFLSGVRCPLLPELQEELLSASEDGTLADVVLLADNVQDRKLL